MFAAVSGPGTEFAQKGFLFAIAKHLVSLERISINVKNGFSVKRSRYEGIYVRLGISSVHKRRFGYSLLRSDKGDEQSGHPNHVRVADRQRAWM